MVGGLYSVNHDPHTVCALINTLSPVNQTIIVKKRQKNRAEILAIWVKGKCVPVILHSTVTSTPSWHVLLLECPVRRRNQGLQN